MERRSRNTLIIISIIIYTSRKWLPFLFFSLAKEEEGIVQVMERDGKGKPAGGRTREPGKAL